MKRESRVAIQIATPGCSCPPQQFFMASRFAQSVRAPVVVFSLAVFFANLCCSERPFASAEDADAEVASAVFPGDDDAGLKGLTAEGAVEFVQSYCIDCHVGEDAESGLDLEGFASAEDVASSIEAWNRIATRVHEGQMPPSDSEMPSQQSRSAFVRWIRDTIYQAVCDDGVQPGGPMLRRLNRTEYANTVRDLLGIPINAGHALPDDGAGGEGFDNAAETLFISPIYAEKYLDAARSAIGHALKDPDDRKRIITATPNDKRSPEQAAREVLAGFLPRAFRRPAGTDEIDEYTQLFNQVYEEDQSYISAIEFTLVAAMVSPKFLFLFEQAGQTDEPTLVSQYEMASRLSYFMWASMPDDELMRLAAQGKLHDDDVLAQQVARMLRSDVDRRGLRRGAKVREFATSFVEQWLGTRALGREFKPDKSVALKYDSELEGGMKYEPIFFFEDLLADNRSLLNLIDSDFTYVNRTLARHYMVKGEFREQPKKVELSEKDHRGGLLGMSAVLAVSSFPHRTSPVLRGKWVLDTLLGTPPPPAPPNVPALEETVDAAQPSSLRERLEKHRSDPVCASCHQAMDPLGFGLENYDVLGRWRTVADGVAIDASGQLPSGETFNGPDELKGLLMDRKEQFMRNLTTKMLGYALARGLTNEDACVVESITRKLAEDEYKAQTLILEIVKSVPFRYKQGS
ncbi:MAG: DUF1592 domain-containing protein [Phycisphaera sp. RhM]|nr:DUF1592 domain-containing protein [Phycisphaera sp. RhM]